MRRGAKDDPDKEALIEREMYMEFPTLDALRRKDIISCLLLGIQDSVCEGEEDREREGKGTEREGKKRERGGRGMERYSNLNRFWGGLQMLVILSALKNFLNLSTLAKYSMCGFIFSFILQRLGFYICSLSSLFFFRFYLCQYSKDESNEEAGEEASRGDFRFFDYQPTIFAKFRTLDGISSPEYLVSLLPPSLFPSPFSLLPPPFILIFFIINLH